MKERILTDVVYNPQTDNPVGYYSKGILIDGNSQCGYNMAAHVAQPLFPNAKKDEWIARYLSRLEDVSPHGLGGMVKALMPWYQGNRMGAAINAHAFALQILIQENNALLANYTVRHPTQNGSLDEIKKAIDSGSPVGICMWPVPCGHFGTIVGYKDDGKILVFHDSYGNFYPSWNPQSYGKGAFVEYPADWVLTKTNGVWAYYYYWMQK